MSKNIEVGAGYRELGRDEILQVGDEYLFGTKWTPTVCEGDVAGETEAVYRRKVYARPESVGAGYRELAPNEIVQAGDEWFSHGDWKFTQCAGDKVKDAGITSVGTLTYRRKVTQAGPGYRILEVGETLQEYDEWRCDGRWLRTNMEGHVIEATDGCPYRRKVRSIQPFPPQVYYSTDSDSVSWAYIPDNPTIKPPLGLMPRSIWLGNRRSEVRAAIRRYADAGRDIPHEWIQESLAFELSDKI